MPFGLGLGGMPLVDWPSKEGLHVKCVTVWHLETKADWIVFVPLLFPLL